MLLIERVMAAFAAFIACDVFGLDSRDIARARRERDGQPRASARTVTDRRQVVVRFGR